MPPQNDGIVLPPRLLLVAPPLHSPLRRGRLFSVGCCVQNFQSAAVYAQGPAHLSIFFIAHLHLTPQTKGQRPLHVPPRSHLLSNAPLNVDDDFRLVVVSPHQTADI